MKKLIVTLLVVFLALAWYSATGLTEEETQIEEEYGDGCTSLLIWEQRLDCCELLYHETLDQCMAVLWENVHANCGAKCPIGNTLEECYNWYIDLGKFDFCVWLTIYDGTFACGGAANDAYTNCLNY